MGANLRGQDGGISSCFGWPVEGVGAFFAEAFDPSFEGLDPDAKGLCDLGLPGAAIGVELTGDGAERIEIILLVGENGHHSTVNALSCSGFPENHPNPVASSIQHEASSAEVRCSDSMRLL